MAPTKAQLKRLNKTDEFHRASNAGHGFFAVDRPSYRQEAATEGWQEVFKWYGKYLAAGTTAAREAVGVGDN